MYIFHFNSFTSAEYSAVHYWDSDIFFFLFYLCKLTLRLNCWCSCLILRCLHSHRMNCGGIDDFVLIDFRKPSYVSTQFIWCWCKHPHIKAENQHFNLRVIVLSRTQCAGAPSQNNKNMSLPKNRQTALYFHLLCFIVLICFVLLCYSLQQRLHLPNFCNNLGEYGLTNSMTNWIWCSTKDIFMEKYEGTFSVSW